MGKNDLCYSCKKNIAGKPGRVEFEYKGLIFKVVKTGMECADCCKKEQIEEFEKFGKDLVKKKNGKIIVNWKLFCEKEIFRSGTYSENIHNAMRDILMSLRILSLESNGNYGIIEWAGISLSPSTMVGPLFFTREEDAVEYAKIKYSRTLYDWEIRHTDKIIKKSDIVKAES